MKVVNSDAGQNPLASKPLSGNDSATPLADSAAFTGDWTAVEVGSLLTVDLKNDVDLDVQIQYSVDGTNIDSTLVRYYRTGFIFPPQLFKNARPYVRVVVTNNSGSAATYMRLNSYISSGEPFLNAPVDSTLSKDYGALPTRPTSFDDEVGLGLRQGWSLWNKFGYNLDIDTGGAEIIASWGGTFARMTSADTLNIVSSSTNDTSAGTGVQSVLIVGIDENRDQQTEIVTMNGTSAVTTSNQWFGINRMAINTVGSGASNAGSITATATSAGSTQGQMPVATNGYLGGVSQQLIFHVPRNHQFLGTYLRFNVNKITGSSPLVTIRGIVYSALNGAIQQVYAETIDTDVVNVVDFEPKVPFPITEQSILYFEATTDTNNTLISGRFGGKLVRDVDA